MPRATWKNTLLAESDETVVVDGNHYFPPETVRTEYFQPSNTTTVCPWKGTARYYDIVIGDAVHPDAAWYYPEPKDAAKVIKNRVAFWRGVDVVDAE